MFFSLCLDKKRERRMFCKQVLKEKLYTGAKPATFHNNNYSIPKDDIKG